MKQYYERGTENATARLKSERQFNSSLKEESKKQTMRIETLVHEIEHEHTHTRARAHTITRIVRKIKSSDISRNHVWLQNKKRIQITFPIDSRTIQYLSA